MKVIACLMIVLAGAGVVFAEGTLERGSGILARENRDISNVRGVRLTTFGTLRIKQGLREELVVSGDHNLLRRIETKVRSGILSIGMKTPITIFRPAQRVEFDLTVMELESIELTGSGDAYADRLDCGFMTIQITGSGDLEIRDLRLANDLDIRQTGSGGTRIDELRMNARMSLTTTGSGDTAIGRFTEVEMIEGRITGSGDFVLTGSSKEVVFRGNGSGDFKCAGLKTQTASVTLTGSGSAVFDTISENLSGKISGSGDLIFSGNPRLMNMKTTGSGDVIQR